MHPVWQRHLAAERQCRAGCQLPTTGKEEKRAGWHDYLTYQLRPDSALSLDQCVPVAVWV